MSWPDASSGPVVEAGDGGNEPGGQSQGLYLGDCGQLPLETRRTLVQLLAGPSLDARRHPKLWPVLVRDEAAVRSRLADLFLELVIDRDQQIAFTRQADVGELEAPSLLRRLPLTFLDSVVLLFLRQRLTQADLRAERAVVEGSEIVDQVAPYERAASTDHAGFGKRIQASVEKMKKSSILQKIRGSEDRYEISPTLKLLFSAEDIAALTQQYRALAEAPDARHAVSPEAGEDTEE
jgi:hypothetical protein